MAASKSASRPTTGQGQLLDPRKVDKATAPGGDYPMGRNWLFKCDVCPGHNRAKCDFARHMRENHDRFAPIPTGHELYTASRPWGGFTVTRVDATTETWQARISPIDTGHRFEGKMVREVDWSQLPASEKKAQKFPATDPTTVAPQTLATSAQEASRDDEASDDQQASQASGNDPASADDQDHSFDSELIDPLLHIARPLVSDQAASPSSTQATQASVNATRRDPPQSKLTQADSEDELASFGSHTRRNTPRDPAAASETQFAALNNHVTATNPATPPLPTGLYESRIRMEAELRSRTTNTPIGEVLFTFAELEAIRTRPVSRPWVATVPPPNPTSARAPSAITRSSESEDKWAADQVNRRMNPGPVPDELIKQCPVLYGNMSNTRHSFAQTSTVPPSYTENETSQPRAVNSGQTPKKAAPKVAPAKAQPKKKVTKTKGETKKGAGTKAKGKGRKGAAAKDDDGSDKEKSDDEDKDKEPSSPDFISDDAHWSSDSEIHYPNYPPFPAGK